MTGASRMGSDVCSRASLPERDDRAHTREWRIPVLKLSARDHRRTVAATLVAAGLLAGLAPTGSAGKRGAGNLDGKFGSHGKVVTTITAPASVRAPAAGGSETFVVSLASEPAGTGGGVGVRHEP